MKQNVLNSANALRCIHFISKILIYIKYIPDKVLGLSLVLSPHYKIK